MMKKDKVKEKEKKMILRSDTKVHNEIRDLIDIYLFKNIYLYNI